MYLMSTNNDPTTPTSVPRKEKDGTRNTITCLTNFVAYNKYLGGIDHADPTTMLGASQGNFTSTSSVVNAYILWKHYKPLTEVSVRLANGLIGSYNSRQRYTVPTPIKEASLISCPARKRARLRTTTSTEPHFPMKMFLLQRGEA